jgi:hypothetical protein
MGHTLGPFHSRLCDIDKMCKRIHLVSITLYSLLIELMVAHSLKLSVSGHLGRFKHFNRSFNLFFYDIFLPFTTS